jgi:NAD+ kinase
MNQTVIETFTSVGLISKYQDPSVCDTLRTLADYLRSRHLEVYLDEGSADLAADCNGLATVDRETLAARCDLVIVVGGDGTWLAAARSLASKRVPLLGVNLGRLGFLTDISPARMVETMDQVLAGQFLEEERFLLQASIHRDGKLVAEAAAVNDVVVHKWNVARMIETEVQIDGLFVYTVRADGLIVSTPTGSTAYALSGGGPILHPTLNATVLVPICPHTMTNRPLVVPGASQIEITIAEGNPDQAQVTCDGQINLSLAAGDRVLVRKHEPIHLIHPIGHDYYRLLREKLHWGRKIS